VDDGTRKANIVTGTFPTLNTSGENNVSAIKTDTGSLKPVSLGLVRTTKYVATSTTDTGIYGFIQSVEYEAASDGIVANVVIGAQGDVSTYVAEADRMTSAMAALSDYKGKVVKFDLSGTELDESSIKAADSDEYTVNTDDQYIATAIDTANNRISLSADGLGLTSKTTGDDQVGNFN
jgi:hypothetical protein